MGYRDETHQKPASGQWQPSSGTLGGGMQFINRWQIKPLADGGEIWVRDSEMWSRERRRRRRRRVNPLRAGNGKTRGCWSALRKELTP